MSADVIETTPLHRTLLGAASAAMNGFFDLLSNTAHAARCAREAERLFAMSDAELAARGLTRDRVIEHAFGPYLAL